MKRGALGIAACTVIALTCVFALTQASATVLCEEQKTACPKIYLVGTQINAALKTMTTSVIETEIAKVTCLENKIGMKTSTKGGPGLSVSARVSEFSFAQCTVPDGLGGTEKCTVSPVNYEPKKEEKQWIALFTNGENGNGKFSITTSELGEFGFSVLCNEKVERINCTFTNITTSTVTGGSGNATIVGAEKMAPVAGGKKCPKAEATWKFTWTVSKPAEFFLEKE